MCLANYRRLPMHPAFRPPGPFRCHGALRVMLLLTALAGGSAVAAQLPGIDGVRSASTFAGAASPGAVPGAVAPSAADAVRRVASGGAPLTASLADGTASSASHPRSFVPGAAGMSRSDPRRSGQAVPASPQAGAVTRSASGMSGWGVVGALALPVWIALRRPG